MPSQRYMLIPKLPIHTRRLIRISKCHIKKENNLMEKYEHLEIEVITFDTEDVITTSGGNENPIETPDLP